MTALDHLPGATDAAARAAWEHDHPRDPWGTARESIRKAMRALVEPNVRAAFDYLDTLERDTKPGNVLTYMWGAPLDQVVNSALHAARVSDEIVTVHHHGVTFVVQPIDTHADVFTRHHEAAQEQQ